jgi:hypothetical protein
MCFYGYHSNTSTTGVEVHLLFEDDTKELTFHLPKEKN